MASKQEKYDKLKAAEQAADERHKKSKEDLAAKQAKKNPGKLTRRELDLAKRMGEGEGRKK